MGYAIIAVAVGLALAIAGTYIDVAGLLIGGGLAWIAGGSMAAYQGGIWRLDRPRRSRFRMGRMAAAMAAFTAAALALYLREAQIWTYPALAVLVAAIWYLQGRSLSAQEALLRSIVEADWNGIAPWNLASPFEGTPLDPREIAATGKNGRKIAIFCDGTSNSPDQDDEGEPAATNIHRMYAALVKNEQQIGWYDPGVGTDASSEVQRATRLGAYANALGLTLPRAVIDGWRKVRIGIEAATGLGIGENITQAYAAIAKHYRPGDAIYLFGFSRGAYTARCVAGMIARCGLLRAENAALAPAVYTLYRTRKDSQSHIPIARDLIHKAMPPIRMLGVFDTVGSLGVPLWGWWFNFRRLFTNEVLGTSPAAICENIFHALAMDERRAQFFPTLFDIPTVPVKVGMAEQRIEQVWFRGAHADIGGGYARSGLSDIALEWMYGHAYNCGLVFDAELMARPGKGKKPLEVMHDEMERRPGWAMLGSWPRWHPVCAGGDPKSRFGALHTSVFERAAAMRAIGRHDLVSLPPVGFVDWRIGATRQWNAAGIVIEHDAIYRLRDTGGSRWQDKDCPLCGPDGQPLSIHDGIRRRAAKYKRLPDIDYMVLCIAIAHPRDWSLREFGIGKLLHYVFKRDPEELTTQIAAIGQDMGEGNAVYIRNRAPGGMLYGFANDLWVTDANNRGGLDLRIERVDPAKIDGPLWTLEAEGRWTAPGSSPP